MNIFNHHGMQKQHNQECLGFFEMACAGICNSDKRCHSHCNISTMNVCISSLYQMGFSSSTVALPRLVPLYNACVAGDGQGAVQNLAGEGWRLAAGMNSSLTTTCKLATDCWVGREVCVHARHWVTGCRSARRLCAAVARRQECHCSGLSVERQPCLQIGLFFRGPWHMLSPWATRECRMYLWHGH
jgi:hypothetical protein